jgi:hypothetical protein
MQSPIQIPKKETHPFIIILFLLSAISLAIVFGRSDNWISQESFVVFQATMLIVISGIAAFYALKVQVKRFDLFHPLVFITIYFYFPQFFLGVLHYIDPNVPINLAPIAQLTDRATAFESTLYVTILGCIGMSMGFLIPLGKRIANNFPQYITLNLPTGAIKNQVTILFILGLVGVILSPFLDGRSRGNVTTGSNLPQLTGVFDFLGNLFLFGLVVAIVATFQKRPGWFWIIIIHIVNIIFDFLTSARRSVLVNFILIYIFAYQYAQAKVNAVRLAIIWFPILIVGLFTGFYFGTTLRNLTYEFNQQQGTPLSIQQTIDLALQVITETSQKNFSDIFQDTLDGTQIRSSGGIVAFSVIVTYKDVHQNEEVQLGIDKSILTNLLYTFTPRILFPDRPNIGGSLGIGAIYFNTPASSPGISYPVDLYRNFGLWGIFPGMFVLGLIFRIFYVWLIEGHIVTPIRAGLYFLVASGLRNFEGDFSSVIPGFVRTVITMIIIIVAIRLLAPTQK